MPESAKASSSPPFRIFETHQFSKDLARLGPALQKRIEAKLRDYVYPILRQNPCFGPNINRLKNWEPLTWRCRIGEWRLFYEIDDQERTVFLVAADHRKQAYRSR
ncbi:MAG: type II toxin-antitoxin system RelE/ParE family toxin [Terriglobia bacterium]|jgi:mRNA interferase RelE/StbE